ncbi:MAG TPA: hypothetical protein VHB97_14030 [Polyangia bacterium]|nr:hypothetical protein [Polyangia bacterium]
MADHPYREPKPEPRVATAADILALLRAGEVVRSLRVTEPLNLRLLADAGDCVHVPLRFVDCRLAFVDCSFSYINAPVVFTGSMLDELLAMAGYFFSGLTIERCDIAGATNLSCGGHNHGGTSVILRDTRFGGFVDFTDNQYEGPVHIERCQFTRGANLFGGHARGLAVKHAVPPIIEDNIGDLDASLP